MHMGVLCLHVRMCVVVCDQPFLVMFLFLLAVTQTHIHTCICTFINTFVGLQLSDPASGDAAPFDVILTTYSMFERDSMDARVDRMFIKKWVGNSYFIHCLLARVH
jgi:hypothetical protein